MQKGFVKIWRKILDAGWIKNHKLCAFWLWCLLKATHKEFNAIVGLQTVHLLPGQFIFGLLKASDETALSIREIRTILEFLKKSENVTIKTTNKFSIITVINWSIYQGDISESDNQSDKQRANKGQHTRTKEHKNIFIVPSVEEITAYCKERNNSVNAQTFFDHYESNGWVVGKAKMKKWKAAVRTWEKSTPTKEAGASW